ncbi:MAG: hypothetical protein P4L87_23290 [Formivibrio sp.]|nr:hypothetical protein [Formivibrio sp.]
MVTNDNLDNLVRIRGLKAEPPDHRECEGLLRSAIQRLKDAGIGELAYSSRFDLAYNAAHALALTALRLRGYRSDRRYLVFQCLSHTLGLDRVSIRIFSLAHERRNLAEYEGYMDEDERLLAELIEKSEKMEAVVKQRFSDAYPAA